MRLNLNNPSRGRNRLRLFFLISALGVLLAVALLELSPWSARTLQQKAVASTVSGEAVPRCRIGGPSRDVRRNLNELGLQVLAQPVNIGCGRVAGEPVALVGYLLQTGVCFVLSRPLVKSVEGGNCVPSALSISEFCAVLCLDGVRGTNPNPAGRYQKSVATGEGRADIKRTLLAVGTRRGTQAYRAVMGYVTGQIQRHLRQGEPFVVFGVVLPECVSPKGVLVRGYDKSGRLVGSARATVVLPHPCTVPRLSKQEGGSEPALTPSTEDPGAAHPGRSVLVPFGSAG